MAKFNANLIDLSAINSGNRYENDDGIDAEAINAPIETAEYMRRLATNQPDISNAGSVGNPSVWIDDNNGNPRFVFSELKGEHGTDHSQDIYNINEILTAHEEKINSNSKSVDNQEKRLDNIEAILGESAFIIDDKIDYSKRVPQYVAPNAMITAIGGHTVSDDGNLKHASVQRIYSHGKNFAKADYTEFVSVGSVRMYKTENSSKFIFDGVATEDVSNFLFRSMELPAGTYTASINGINEEDNGYIGIMGTSGNYLATNIRKDAPVNFTISEDTICYVAFVVSEGSAYANQTVTFQVENGYTATEWSEFKEDVFEIPYIIQTYDGYGMGIDNKYYNRIEYQDNEKVAWIKNAELFSLDSSLTESQIYVSTEGRNGFAVCVIELPKKGAIYNSVLNLNIPYDYNYYGDYVHYYTSDTNFVIVLPTATASTPAEFVRYVSNNPIYCLYPLANAEITDITYFMPSENTIGVDGLGTLTAINANMLPTATTVVYQKGGLIE